MSLNSIVMNGARVIGPAIGGVAHRHGRSRGVLRGERGVVRRGHRRARADAPKRAPRDGADAAGARGNCERACATRGGRRDLRDVLLVVFVVGTLAYNFTVMLPLFAQADVPRGSRRLLAAHVAHGGRGRRGWPRSWRAGAGPTSRRLGLVGIGFGVFILALALVTEPARGLRSRSCPMGGLSIAFIATANSTIQMQVDPTPCAAA